MAAKAKVPTRKRFSRLPLHRGKHTTVRRGHEHRSCVSCCPPRTLIGYLLRNLLVTFRRSPCIHDNGHYQERHFSPTSWATENRCAGMSNKSGRWTSFQAHPGCCRRYDQTGHLVARGKALVSIKCTDDALTVRSVARHLRHAALKAQAVHWRATSARRPTPRVRIGCADGALPGRRLAICYSQIANDQQPARGTIPPACDSRAGHAAARSA